MMTQDDELFKNLLERLRTGDESHQLEAKKGSAVDTSILETICAFSNEPGLGGGYILLGVVRDESQLFPDYEVIGIDNSDKIQSDLSTQCAEKFNIALRPRVYSAQSGDKTVLIVAVSEAGIGEKPIYFKSKGLPKGAYRRIGSTDQTCTEDDISILFQGRSYKAYEVTELDDLDTSLDFSEEAIKAYRSRREKINPSAAELTYSKDELLYSLGAVSRQRGRYVPTVCGLVCFGTEQALRRVAPMTRVDYIRIPGRVWVENPENRFETIEMRGPLLTVIPRAVNAVLDDLPKSFAMEDNLYRKDKPLIPEVVIREAVVNAVMHRSYRNKMPVQIIRYSNRIEIRNPGCSLKPDDQLGEAGSVNRNELIATILHECNLAETKGSGIRVMKEMMDRANLSLPFFESNRESDTFVMTLLTHHFMDENDIVWLENFRDCELTPEEAKAMVFLKEVGAISNAAYRDINRVETLQASSHLRKLRILGLLEQKGKGAATYYQPGARFIKSVEAESLSDNLESLSANPQGLSDQLRQELPANLVQTIETLGERSSPTTMESVIYEICAFRPYSRKEIADMVGRNEAYIKTYLSKLSNEGLISLTIPENPTHPDQKYRANK